MLLSSTSGGPRCIGRTAVGLLTIGLLALSVTATASAWPTYRSASVTCTDATLYGNYSPKSGPKDKLGTVVRGEVLGYQYTWDNGAYAIVRTHLPVQLGFVQRSCITVPKAGTSGSYLWPAVISCQDATMYGSYNSTKRKPGRPTGTVKRGQHVGYQWVHPVPSGPYVMIRKGTQKYPVYGYVLHECVNVANWAPSANWNPAK